MISRRENEPPIIDPRKFLDKPFTRLEVGKLPTSPDIELLRWLPTLKDETGLVFQIPNWYIIKASERGVPSYIMPKNSDTLLHSHPTSLCESEEDGFMPSLRDYYNCSPTAKNFIASSYGITQYWPVDGPTKKKELENAIYRESMGRDLPKKEYLDLLQRIGANLTLHEWKSLNNKELKMLLETVS